MIAAHTRMYAAHTWMITTPAQDIDTPLLKKCQIDAVCPISVCTHKPDIDGILPKGPYPPCLRMADRAPLAGYPRYKKTNTILMMFIHYLLTIANTCRVFIYVYYVKEMQHFISKLISFMKVLIFLDLFFYMEHIIFLGIIAMRSSFLLSGLYSFYDTHAISY